MPFKNRIRLPLYLTRPQFPETRKVFTKSNGQIKVLSAQIKKIFDLKTDYFPAKWHERLAIALGHDVINIQNKNKLFSIVKETEYEIEWIEPLDYPVAQAQTKVAVADFEAVNSNCQTCEDICCAIAPDETITSPATIEESDVFVFAPTLYITESLCTGLTLDVVSINELYVDSVAELTPGQFTFTMKPAFFSNPTAEIATYRVSKGDTCFDVGKIYGNVVGTAVGCPPPTGLSLSFSSSSQLDFSWTRAVPDTGEVDFWELYEGIVGGIPVQSGGTLTGEVSFTTLDAGTTYVLRVRSWCGADSYSDWIELSADTLSLESGCGMYSLSYEDYSAFPEEPAVNVTYRDCDDIIRNVLVYNFISRTICAKQTTEGVPDEILFPASVTYSYLGLC